MLTGMIGEELSHDSELGMQSVSLCDDSVSMNDNDPSNNVTLAAPPSNEQGVFLFTLSLERSQAIHIRSILRDSVDRLI